MVEKFKSWNKAILIPIEQLELCDWNANVLPDKEFAELCKEIKEGGFDEPCQVVPSEKKSGKYLILGGEHRFKAAIANNFKEIPCVVKEHLSDSDDKDKILWSVKRNNIRGKLDEKKYAKLEKRLKSSWNVDVEQARRDMLLKDEQIKTIKRSVIEDNDKIELTSDDTLDLSKGSSQSNKSDSQDTKSSNGNTSDGGGSTKFSARRELLQALKSAEEEVLLQSSDTVEFGYLAFGQGNGIHLVINETQKLRDLVSRLVAAGGSNSEGVIAILESALEKCLPDWE